MNAGVPEEVLAYYSDLFQRVSETEDWIEYAESNAMTVSFMPYQEFAAYAAEIYHLPGHDPPGLIQG